MSNIPFVNVIEEMKARALVQQHRIAIEHINESLAEMAEEARKARRRKKKHAKELEIAESRLEEILNATNKTAL
jgi:hypothetical protein